MLKNKNEGPKTHKNWLVKFRLLQGQQMPKQLKICVGEISIMIALFLPDLHLFLEWNMRLSVCLIECNTIQQENEEAP